MAGEIEIFDESDQIRYVNDIEEKVCIDCIHLKIFVLFFCFCSI